MESDLEGAPGWAQDADPESRRLRPEAVLSGDYDGCAYG